MMASLIHKFPAQDPLSMNFSCASPLIFLTPDIRKAPLIFLC
uniref:Uncharacterized protein n=1 Tax=Rhizophora mucronata TaxID=61149 RepID=A0A2P2J834_RHIMU